MLSAGNQNDEHKIDVHQQFSNYYNVNNFPTKMPNLEKLNDNNKKGIGNQQENIYESYKE